MFSFNKSKELQEQIIKLKEDKKSLKLKAEKSETSYKAAHAARVMWSTRVKTALEYIETLPKETQKIKRSDIDKINNILEGNK